MSSVASPWRRASAWWLSLALLLLVVSMVCLLFGQQSLSLSVALSDPDSIERAILLELRLPRILFAIVAGGGLSVAGAVYQALLRNDLADPYTLGVSGGASFGALLVVNLAPLAIKAWLLPACAFAFAGFAVVMIYAMARLRGPTTPPTTLILAGVTLNLIFAAGILLVQYLSDPSQTITMLRWLMGSVDTDSMRLVLGTGAFVLVGTLFLSWRSAELNLMSLGEMTAANLGLDVERARIRSLALASAIAALVVAYAGPIGFVGLIVPHLLRRIIGPDHRIMLPSCFLFGAAFLVVCDTIARSTLSMTELPVGIITSFIGGPFFLYILLRRGN